MNRKISVPVAVLCAALWAALWIFEFSARNQPALHDGLYLGAVASFVIDLIVVAGAVGCVGFTLTSKITGVAINGLNQYSLSRAQMAGWTIVVVAALSTVLRIRLTGFLGPVGSPLNVRIPGELLAAMGISALSTVAAPAVLAIKAGQAATPDDLKLAEARMKPSGTGEADRFSARGKALVRVDRDKASWKDMLLGDELANAGVVDISKVQQALITVLLIGAYLFAVVSAVATGTCAPASDPACPADVLNALPALSETFVELLALSHAGYLAYKAVPKVDPNSNGSLASDAQKAV